MNLKSYARGIGAGLIVAALVLGIGSKPEKMTDEQIKLRATELGMIESSTLTQINTEVSSETGASVEEVKEEETNKVPETSDVSDNEPESKTDISETSTDEPTPELKEPDEVTVDPILPEPEEEKTPASIDPMPEEETGYTAGDESVTIRVVRGDSSVSVARRMYEAGLVDSAVEFDKYLCENGYDKIISVGTYEIAFGLSFEDMARIITRR